MASGDWPQYWLDHGWVQVACLVGTVALFCFARLAPRPYAGIDYAVHFHGAHSTRDGALSLPPRRPVPIPYRASLRVMNTGGSEIPEPELPGGVVITVRPPPGILVGMIASPCVPRGSVSLEPGGPACVAVVADRLRPGDWIDVDLLSDRPVSIESVTATTSRRSHAPRRRRLREYDGTQLVVDLIGLPVAVVALAVVGSALPEEPASVLDVVASYGWLFLGVWALLSAWGLMEQTVRFTERRKWRGHPRVFLRWADGG